MDANQAINLRKRLKEGQTLEIDFQGNVAISWRNSKKPNKAGGRKQYIKFGKIEDFPESILPLRGKLWANISTTGIKKWNRFGVNLPKRDSKESELLVLLAIYELLQPKELGKHKESSFVYDVKIAGKIKGFYSNGVLRFIESNGKRFYIKQTFPKDVFLTEGHKNIEIK